MSCITEILKLKGDREVLLPLNEDGKPWIAVEGGGTYKDHEYLIVLNSRGHRCGYIAIHTGHPYDISEVDEEGHSNYWNLDIKVHGGLTFMSRTHGLKELLSTSCTDQWIGFDCGHSYDKSDVEATEKYYGKERREHIEKYMDYCLDQTRVLRTFQYAEQECHSIIDQLIEKQNAT